MLRISKLADYGTVIMNYLALYPNQVYSAAALAEILKLTLPTVSKILKILSEAKLVVSIRGVEGGYRLAKPAAEITVAQVIAAIEGLPALTECCKAEKLCAQDNECSMRDNWNVVNRFILTVLSNLTLADMTQKLDFNLLANKAKLPQINSKILKWVTE